MLKKVIYPLYVPVGRTCYEGINEDDDTICPHLVMDGGHPNCLLNFEPTREENEITISKDPDCLELVDFKE
jgi:hypothetical protein